MQIPITLGAYEARSRNLNSQRCVNFFPVTDQQGGKAVNALYATPGLKEWVDLGFGAEVRGMHVLGDYLYVVCGEYVYHVTRGGTATRMSGQLFTQTGVVSMANNPTQVMIVDGSRGYVITGGDASTATLAEIADTDLPDPSSVTFQDTYFIASRKDTGRFYISSSNDGTSWDALDYATAEAQADDLVCVLSDHKELWLIGKDTIEVYYNSGATDFPFERIPGAFVERGCANGNTVCKMDNSVYWLGSDGNAYRASGYSPEVISTDHIAYAISQGGIANAQAFSYTMEGHSFYVLTLPSIDRTFVFDSSTMRWHERASGPNPYDNRWRANCHAHFANRHIVGDMANGKIYELDYDTYDEDEYYLKSFVRFPAIGKERKHLFFNRLEVEFETGVGLVAGQGEDPQAMLRWSDDGAHTWSNEHWADIGAIGNYTTRAVWHRMGASRERVFEVAVTDPVKRVILGAYLEADLGAY